MPAAIRIDLCSTAEVAPGNALQVDKAGPVLAVFMPVPGQQPNTHDWGARYPLIVQAVNKLKARSCLIDGEAVCCNEHGVPIFEKLRHRSNDQSVILIAFDLLELDGTDLRHEPFETRKATLASLLRGCLCRVCSSMRISRSPATSCSGTPARWALKASCRSGWARATAPAARPTGSSSRTRRHRR
jgi:hypothetical protein